MLSVKVTPTELKQLQIAQNDTFLILLTITRLTYFRRLNRHIVSMLYGYLLIVGIIQVPQYVLYSSMLFRDNMLLHLRNAFKCSIKI